MKTAQPTRPENQTPTEQAGLARAKELLGEIENLDEAGAKTVNETAEKLLRLHEECAAALIAEARRQDSRVSDPDRAISIYLKTSPKLKTRGTSLSPTRVGHLVRYATLRRDLLAVDPAAVIPTNTGMCRPLLNSVKLTKQMRVTLWQAAVSEQKVGGWPTARMVSKVVADAGFAPVKQTPPTTLAQAKVALDKLQRFVDRVALAFTKNESHYRLYLRAGESTRGVTEDEAALLLRLANGDALQFQKLIKDVAAGQAKPPRRHARASDTPEEVTRQHEREMARLIRQQEREIARVTGDKPATPVQQMAAERERKLAAALEANAPRAGMTELTGA